MPAGPASCRSETQTRGSKSGRQVAEGQGEGWATHRTALAGLGPGPTDCGGGGARRKRAPTASALGKGSPRHPTTAHDGALLGSHTLGRGAPDV